jgi:hypothetical protein
MRIYLSPCSDIDTKVYRFVFTFVFEMLLRDFDMVIL